MQGIASQAWSALAELHCSRQKAGLLIHAQFCLHNSHFSRYSSYNILNILWCKWPWIISSSEKGTNKILNHYKWSTWQVPRVACVTALNKLGWETWSWQVSSTCCLVCFSFSLSSAGKILLTRVVEIFQESCFLFLTPTSARPLLYNLCWFEKVFHLAMFSLQ